LDNLYTCAAVENPSNIELGEIYQYISGNNLIGAAAKECLNKYGWKIISEPPWISSDMINDKDTILINIPLNSFHVVGESNKSAIKIYNDKNTSLSWTIVGDKAYSWGAAIEAINRLNSVAYAGYNDWHMPSINDFGYLIKGKSEAITRKILGEMSTTKYQENKQYLYWTITSPVNSTDQFYAVDLFSSNFSIIDKEGPFACKLMVVRGHGWENNK